MYDKINAIDKKESVMKTKVCIAVVCLLLVLAYYGYPDGGYSHIEYGDQIQFAVMKESGLVRLYAFVDE